MIKIAEKILTLFDFSRIFVTILLLPLLGCFCLHYAIGDSIYGLTLGIVNNEVETISECYDPSLKTSVVKGFDCFINKVSCKFITQFDPDIADLVEKYKIFVNSFDFEVFDF